MRPGIIELRWGDPDPALIPVAGHPRGHAVGDRHRRRGGAQLRRQRGARGAARAALAERIAAARGRAGRPRADRRHQRHLPVASSCSSPTSCGPATWSSWRTRASASASAWRATSRLDLVAVPLDEDGLDVEALAEAVRDVRASGRRPRLVYTVRHLPQPHGRVHVGGPPPAPRRAGRGGGPHRRRGRRLPRALVRRPAAALAVAPRRRRRRRRRARHPPGQLLQDAVARACAAAGSPPGPAACWSSPSAPCSTAPAA